MHGNARSRYPLPAPGLFRPCHDPEGARRVHRPPRRPSLQPEGRWRSCTEAHLVAEGLRKLACLAHLVSNGSLTTNGILFWDEPEANLNPRLASLVVDILLELGKRGVQIFMTTHDDLLSHKLSLLSEYRKQPDVPIRFFAFHRHEAHGPVLVDAGGMLAELPSNPISTSSRATTTSSASSSTRLQARAPRHEISS